MIADIPVSALQGWGAGGLLSFLVLLIILGKIGSPSQMRDLREERDKWRAAAETNAAALDEILRTSREQLDLAKTANHLIESLPRPGGGGS